MKQLHRKTTRERERERDCLIRDTKRATAWCERERERERVCVCYSCYLCCCKFLPNTRPKTFFFTHKAQNLWFGFYRTSLQLRPIRLK